MVNKSGENPFYQSKKKVWKNWRKGKKGLKQNKSFNSLNSRRLQMFSGKRGK